MTECADEVEASRRRGAKADTEGKVLAKIAAMPGADRAPSSRSTPSSRRRHRSSLPSSTTACLHTPMDNKVLYFFQDAAKSRAVLHRARWLGNLSGVPSRCGSDPSVQKAAVLGLTAGPAMAAPAPSREEILSAARRRQGAVRLRGPRGHVRLDGRRRPVQQRPEGPGRLPARPGAERLRRPVHLRRLQPAVVAARGNRLRIAVGVRSVSGQVSMGGRARPGDRTEHPRQDRQRRRRPLVDVRWIVASDGNRCRRTDADPPDAAPDPLRPAFPPLPRGAIGVYEFGAHAGQGIRRIDQVPVRRRRVKHGSRAADAEFRVRGRRVPTTKFAPEHIGLETTVARNDIRGSSSHTIRPGQGGLVGGLYVLHVEHGAEVPARLRMTEATAPTPVGPPWAVPDTRDGGQDVPYAGSAGEERSLWNDDVEVASGPVSEDTNT